MDNTDSNKPKLLTASSFVPVLVLLLVAVAGWLVVNFESSGRVGWWATASALALAALAVVYLVVMLVRIERRSSGRSGSGQAAAEATESSSHQFVDNLTGLAARYWFEQNFAAEIARSKRYHRPLSLVVLDIDHFGRLNRTQGEQRGDSVLVAVATILRENLRQTDHKARIENDEFAVVLSETTKEGALLVGEKLRRMVGEHQFGDDLKLTVSIGVATVEDADSVDSFLHRGKAAAMTARRDGGNAVATATY